ncbi:MAG: gliding motility-associated C-terminal domain-containing protein [Bacteroidia bacterium]|nr:gliding motility-associated C-terminal domain-containing protein [Bacteroidia bacterium]
MKKIISVCIFCFVSLIAFAQSNDCSTATALVVTANCSSPVSGTTIGATQSLPACTGVADDDVWYAFTASGTSQYISITGNGAFDPVFEIFSGSCGSLVSLNCIDNTFGGGTETLLMTGLTTANVYYIRVFDYGTGTPGNFTICVSTPPTAPANNICGSATALTVNAACSYTNGTTFGATQSFTGCVGTADDDVWYSFVANSPVMNITVDPSASMDAVVELYSGTCGSLTSIQCEDIGLTNGNETVNAVGLILGQTYLVRVYDYYGGNGYPFQICITGTPPVGIPSNDNACGAIALPTVTSDCNFSVFSNVNATETASPAPSSCVGGGGAMDGGFSTATIKDVWFSVVVPANVKITITAMPNMGAGYISDGVIALYSGACGSLTQIACSDDNAAYPGSGNDLLPYISASGLTPGTTVYIRYWGYGSSVAGNFGICVSSPTNDNCANALYICDINGYGASTSSAYTPDRPGNMFGNNETAAGVDQPDGINTGGIFGQGGGWGTGSPFFDVNINNNSWIRFTAANTSAVLNVTIGNCWVGNYPSGGIQMQIFSGTNCTTFTPVSDFKEGSTNFTITANNLIVGNDYYLMVDGFAGDICNYTITANSGVQFPGITALPDSVCPGGSSTLTGPNGASAYYWEPGGQTTQSIIVTPPYSMTYTCVASGICGFKQTITKTVYVKPLPTVSVNATSNYTVNVCGQQNTTLTATGAGTYSWSSGQSSSSIIVNPSSTTSYTVTGNLNGCTNTAVATVNVLPLPSVTASGTSICLNSSGTISAAGASTYSWSSGQTGSSVSVSPTSTTSYTVTGTALNSCTNTAVATVTVLSLPVVTASGTSICFNSSGTISAAGASTYSWSSGQTGSSASVSPASTTSYTVTGTALNSCTNTAVATVTVLPLPSVTANGGIICNGQSATISASGASTYVWSNSATGANTSVSPTSTTNYTVTGTDANSCVNTATASVTVNPLPVINISPLTVCSNQSGTITASGAVSYSWSTGASGPSISVANLSANTTYTVNGTDGNNCTNANTVTVQVNLIPTLASTPTITQSNCGLSTGAITGVVVNGSGALSYSWTNSVNAVVGTSASITNIPAGNYNLTVTDANGCSDVFSFNISNPGAPVSPTATALAPVICAGDSINLFASTISTATYQWTGPNGFNSSSQNPVITPSTTSASGTYSVIATVNNCTGPAGTVSVTVNALPIVSAASQQNTYCSGDSVNLFGSGGTIYSWTGPNGFSSASQNPVVQNSSVNASGTYSLVVTDVNGCINSATVGLLVNSTPQLSNNSVAPNDSVCAGSNVTFSVSSTGSPVYSWTGPNGFSGNSSTVSLSNAATSQSGTYSVVATENNCSSQLLIVNLTVNPLPIVSAATQQNTYCSGDSINLSGSGGTIYSWTGPNGFSSASQNPVVQNSSVNASGTYSLVVTDANGCVNSATVGLLVNPTPQLSNNSVAPNDSVCAGSNVTLSVSSTGSPVYSWTGPNGFTGNSSTINLNNTTVSQSGTYSVVAIENNCSSQLLTVTLVVNPLPNASATVVDPSVCASQTIQLNASGANSYSWSGPNGFTSSQQSPQISPAILTASGIYTVTVTDANNCSASSTVSVTVNALPSVTAQAFANSLCSGSTISLSANGGGVYSWTGPNSFVSASQNPAIINATTNAGGTYTVTVTDINGCSSSDTVNVSVTQTPQMLSTISDSTCNNGALSLNATASVGTINWYSDAALTNLVGTGASFSPTGLINDSLYTFYAVAVNGPCSSAVVPVTAIVHSVIASLSANPLSGPPPLNVTFTNTSTGLNTTANILWNFGNGNTSTAYNANENYPNTGNYQVTLIVMNTLNLCADTAQITITVTDEITTVIPNVFTPNGDGVNDFFTFLIYGAKEAEGIIYNRWGQVMFSWTGSNGTWDGKTPLGNEASAGTYFYILKAKSFSDEEKEFKGYLLLVR